MTYYCGSAPICKKGGNFDVLQRAKYNVEAYYSLVGMAQDLKRSFELLEVLLPAFFSGVKSIFKEDYKLNQGIFPLSLYFAFLRVRTILPMMHEI